MPSDNINSSTKVIGNGMNQSSGPLLKSMPMNRPLLKEPLAVIAMECRLPQADSISEYWELLCNGKSAITPFPEEVLPRDRYYDAKKGVRGKSYTTRGGLIKQRPLDWNLLGLKEKEATLDWDECHLIFAEVAAKAWSSLRSAQSDKVGVYIGHSGGSRLAGDLIYATMAPEVLTILEEIPEFQSLDANSKSQVARAWLHRMQSGAPKRLPGGRPRTEASAAAKLVAEVCNLHGPQMVLDAACASSLVALALAAIDLQSGTIDSAIVGGASYNKVDSHILFSQAQSCSANDSHPFDQAADGLIAAEGYIALVIKTLRQAVQDGDDIRGVIRGVGIATDGRGKSLWAPRREGQFNAMARAYDCGVSPSNVQFVEAHATSTQVGDATETQALTDFFGSHHRQGSLPVGSVKSNIGHTLETAGLAGMLKTILAMEHGAIPPTINLEKPSTEIDWDNAPFYVPTKRIPWNKPSPSQPRCGAVNAFGIGGLNVHVVVEEYCKNFHAKFVSEKVGTLSNSVKPGNRGQQSLNSKEPIAIVGLGIILPGAQSDVELENLLANDKSYIVEPPKGRCVGPSDTKNSISRIEIPTFKGGYLTEYKYDWKRHRVPPKQVAQANPLQFMLLDAAGQALVSAEKLLGQDGNERTSVIVGTVFGGEFAHQLQIGLRLHDLRHSLAESMDAVFNDTTKSDAVRTKTKASRRKELETLRDSIVDAMEDKLVIRFPALLDETGSFTSSTLASRITKQFHLLGGAMAIDSGSCASDAALHTAVGMLRNNSTDTVLCAGGQRAMDFISYEALAARDVLGKNGMAGMLPGEGAVVVLLKRMSDAVANGDKIKGIIHDVTLIRCEDQKKIAGKEPRKTNSEIVYDKERLTRKTGDLQGAQGLASLAASLCDSSIGDGTQLNLLSESMSGTQFKTTLTKGAVVNRSSIDSTEDLNRDSMAGAPHTKNIRDQNLLASKNYSHAMQSPPRRRESSRSNVLSWQRPRIAAIFPGQGSQCDEMFKSIAERSHSAKETIGRANQILQTLGSVSIEKLCSQACDSSIVESNRIWPIQATVLVADVTCAEAFSSLGIDFDVVCGHSLGELAALVVAGAWSLESALRFTFARSEAVRNAVESDPEIRETGLLSIAESNSNIVKYLKTFARPVYMTHQNGPNQCVVGGRKSDLLAFQSMLRESRVSSVLLEVPVAFHTPLLARAQMSLTQAVQNAVICPPRIPFLSTVTGRFVSDPDEIRRNLLDQIISPVVYQTAVTRMFHEGVRGFVELGSGSVLTRLNQCIFKERQFEGASISTVAVDDLTSYQDWYDDACELGNNTVTVHANHSSLDSNSPSIEQTKAPILKRPAIVMDATTGRRQRRRQQSLGSTVPVLPGKQNSSIDNRRSQMNELHVGSSVRDKNLADLNSIHEIEEKTVPSPVSEKTRSSALGTDGKSNSLHVSNDDDANRNTDELEAFIRDFIVEHTGYPAEMVQMDWDLEADLGIDSIKQAQLFGELRELFEIDLTQPAKISIRTMRDIVELLSGAGGKREWLEDSESVEVERALEIPNSNATDESLSEPIKLAQNDIPNSDSSLSEIALGSASRDQLADFMVDFVIDQTGYPREMVAFDADLEADLGLDSIKMAQLFGELKSQFELPINLGNRKQLSATRSLNDILNLFGYEQPTKSTLPQSSNPQNLLVDIYETNEDSLDEESFGLDDDSFADPLDVDMSASIIAGKAWGAQNANALQKWLIDEVDRLEPSTCTSAKIRITPANISQHDRNAWWHGVAAGSQLAEECVLAWADTIETMLDTHSPNNEPYDVATVEDSIDLETDVESDYEMEELQGHVPSVNGPKKITGRYLLRMVDNPLPSTSTVVDSLATGQTIRWTGAAVILGSNPLQEALRDRLNNDNVPVYVVDTNLSQAEIIESLDRIWQKQPVMHVFIATPHDKDAKLKLDSRKWKKRRDAGMLGPFWFCQHWFKLLYENKLVQEATLVGAANLGGSFGLEEQVVAPESGCMAGMLKAIVIEAWVNGFRKMAVKVIDFATSDHPDAMVDAMLKELSHQSYTMEVSWAGGTRRTIQAYLSPLPSRRVGKKSSVTKGGNWIFTGGGRGITALVAEELSAKYSLVAHLVGTAAVPDIPDEWKALSEQGKRELQLKVMNQARRSNGPDAANPLKAWQNVEKAIEIDATLKRMRARGIEAHYYSCDCNSPTEVKQLVKQIRAKSGPISGCLHGAGVGQDARFDRKRRDKVDQCLSAKFDGAIALMEATKSEPLEYFIGFGSISGRFGANGHTDYSAANDGLAKVVDWFRSHRPDVNSTTFHWHAWGDVGMATKPATKLALEMIDMQFMPAREGLDHLVAEIEAGAPEREVLITDDQYYRAFYPSESVENVSDPLATVGIGEALVGTDLKVTFDPVRDVFLKEHCLSGRPLLPMVIGIETIVQAAAIEGKWKALQHGGPMFSIENLQSKRGLRWFTNSPIESQMVVVDTGNESASTSYHVELTADFRSRAGELVDKGRVHFVGDVSILPPSDRLDWSFPKTGEREWRPATYPPAGAEFFVGPAFKMLNHFSIESGKLYGRLFSPPLGELAGVKRSGLIWRTPSAVLDSCLFATGILAWNQVRPGISLPVSIDQLHFFHPPKFGDSLLVETRLVDQDERSAWFDFSVWASDGTICLEAISYRTMSLQGDVK